MASLLVDARTLLSVRDSLGQLHGELLGINTVADGVQGTFGGRLLESTVEQLCDASHQRILQLGSQIAGNMDRLLKAAEAYEREEQAISGQGTGASSGSGTTTVGGGSHHPRPTSGAGSHHPRPTSGSGTTTVGGGPSSGSGTTTIGPSGSTSSTQHPPHPPARSSGSRSGSGRETIG